jgi:hypothetical protein
MSNDRESGIRALADKIIKENEAKALEAQRYTDSQSWKDKEFNQAERFHNDEMATDRYVAGLNYSNRNRETPENGYGSEDFRNGLADVDDIFKATNDTIDNTWYTGGSLEDYKIGLLSQLYNVARTLQPDEAAVMTRKLDTAVASLNKQKKSKPVNAKPRESLEEASRLPYTQWNTQVQKTLPSTGGKIPEKYRIPYYTDVDKYYKPKF